MLAVAVALRPADFDGGAEAPDGSAWDLSPLFDETFKTNPRLLLDPGDLEMVTLWGLYRRGHLPDAGGAANQASVMIDAFLIMEDAAARMQKGHSGGVG